MLREAIESRPDSAQESAPTSGPPEARLNGLLWKIARNVGGIRGLVISDPKGLPVVSLARGRDTAAAAAMATLLGSAASKVASGLGASPPTEIVIETPELLVMVHFMGAGYVLLAAIDKDINPGFARLELARYHADLKALLDSLR